MDNKNKSVYNFIGFVIALVFYVGVLFFLAFYLQEKIRKNIKYTTKKNVVLDITLVEKKSKPKKNISKKSKKNTRKIASKPVPKKHKSKSTKKVPIQGLFKNINLKSIKEPRVKKSEPKRKKVISAKKVQKSNISKNEAKKIVESGMPIKRRSQYTGQYNKFNGKIQQILDENWQNTISTISGNSGDVTVFIDKKGTFGYKIKNVTGSNDFNSKLREFLEEMSDKKFPPYSGEGVFRMDITFKDIRE